MIKSMTGFGKEEANSKSGTIKIELRTVNHKFLDMSVKLPDGLLGFEDRVRGMIGRFVRRGRVNLSLIYEDGVNVTEKIVVDEKIARAYYRQLLGLKKNIHLEGSIRLEHIISLPGVITYEAKAALPENIWPCIEAALKKALKKLNESRLKEGMAICVDLKKRVKNIEKQTTLIKTRAKINIKLYRKRLKKSISEILGTSAARFDKGRLEQEVALYAKNSDVTEEITRILAHTRSLRDSIEKDIELGKKLDFIAQELNREVNTIGSKASDFKISQKVIQVKSEIDKLREQAKNIE